MTSIRRGLTLGVKSGGPKGLSLTGPTSSPREDLCLCCGGSPLFSVDGETRAGCGNRSLEEQSGESCQGRKLPL